MRLKSRRTGPDTPGMIAPASGPPAIATEGLHALYVSLNSPVVSVERLPVGPAAAAIAVHGVGTTLLIRSVRTGTVACYQAEPRFGLEAALSHAEGLGFLFDDEANLAGAGAERSGWPAWLAEIFADPAEREFTDPGAWLSKFRWRPASRPTQSAARFAQRAAGERRPEGAQRAQVSRSEPQASEAHQVGERGRASARDRNHSRA